MSRPALNFKPTYGEIAEKHDAYVHSTQLRALAKQHGRYWSFHSIPTTVALPDNRFAKSLSSFTNHTTEDSFMELLREYASHGCERPSGYADVFHDKFISPRVGWSINSQLAPCMAGGWQSATNPGVHKGVHYRYDMRSAYLWSATLGLPDPKTYTRSLTPWKDKYDGLYRIKLVEPSPNAPFPFNQARECIATNAEIETYGLRVGEVVDGVIWKRTIDGAKVVEAVKAVSTWKEAGRSYWGRWAQLQKVECTAKGRKWSLPNTTLNIPWAHAIVSRVKMRLWTYSGNSVHVYVDSVITPEVIPTGNELGDWRLEKTYTQGVFIRGPGQYGALGEGRLERMAGAAPDSPQRNISIAAVQ